MLYPFWMMAALSVRDAEMMMTKGIRHASDITSMMPKEAADIAGLL